MNKVILMGRLTRDPNVRYSPRNNSQEEIKAAGGENLQDALLKVGISAKEALNAFESIYRLRRQEKSNNWRKYHGLPLKRSKGGKRRGDRKRNDSNSENTGIS